MNIHVSINYLLFVLCSNKRDEKVKGNAMHGAKLKALAFTMNIHMCVIIWIYSKRGNENTVHGATLNVYAVTMVIC